MLRRPTPEWYVMVDSWLNIPYPEWYVCYVKVHFQAALSPDAFMGAFSQEARGTVDAELAQVCAHPLLAPDPLTHLPCFVNAGSSLCLSVREGELSLL